MTLVQLSGGTNSEQWASLGGMDAAKTMSWQALR